MIELLAKPITDLLGAFGSGVIPTGGPTDVIRASSGALDSISTIGRSAVAELASTWSGPAAAAAIELAGQAHTSAVGLSDHGSEIAAIVDLACDKVYAGVVELQGIAQSFAAIAMSAAPLIFTPPAQTMLIAAAIEHLQQALAVVARVRAELAAHTAEISAFASPPAVPQPAGAAPGTAPAAAGPQVAGGDPGSQFLQNFTKTMSSSASSVSPDGPTSPLTSPAGTSSPSMSSPGFPSSNQDMSTAMGTPARSSAAVSGEGVEVALPDGSVAVAPNEQAAGAVRSALTQQGTDYSWGGNEPGRGLDCSGLTKWAYGEQGVELPRLAQEQYVGASVNSDEVMPGDLAIWDGHVAMVIGNGQMVEGVEPQVQVSEIRTTNGGMGFKGFYRPTLAP
ncbi:NlpC/P60 family protein [Rhodococcus sp. G-MC3]|uniref:C40 family peptidase n=1 Tax=Rhodococcus sp. G-MC3 TaxID=3046209 RepID=UPI0024BA1084|nr:C40 family peptidase [Rhodococcus sp. G-MC3]MDJ0395904.1 NlpC/P60 family protein [Rhodococcus sp. G-MC3]